jgi:type I restriction enzyme R subunit
MLPILAVILVLLVGIEWLSVKFGLQQTRAEVLSAIRFKLDELPEEPYPEAVWNAKVNSVWQFVFHRSPSGAAQSPIR